MIAAIVYSLSLAVIAVSAQDTPAVAPTPAAAGVYVPGGAGQVPGAQLVTLGAGSDGFTAYQINGVVLAENGQQVMMTSVDASGSVVYDCQLGADAQATCNVVQQYNGVQYAYTEPITYFGGALATPSVSSSTTDPALSSTTPTAIVAAVSTTTSSTATSSSVSSAPTSSSSSSAASSSSITTTRSMVGPQPGVPQSTSSNIFLPAGASTGDGSTSGASGRQAGLYGCGAMLSALAYLIALA